MLSGLLSGFLGTSCNNGMGGLGDLGDLGYLAALGLTKEEKAAIIQAKKDAAAAKKAAAKAFADKKKAEHDLFIAQKKAAANLPPSQKRKALKDARVAYVNAVKAASQAKKADIAHAVADQKAKVTEVNTIAKAEAKKNALEKKQARINKKLGNKNISALPEESAKIDQFKAAFDKLQADFRAAKIKAQSARTPAERKDAAATITRILADMGANVGGLNSVIAKLPTKLPVRKSKGLRYSAINGLGEDPLPDQSFGEQPFGGVDPALLQQLQPKPVELPKKCQKRPNDPLCVVLTLSQQTQQQMSVFMALIMSMQQELMQLLQQLLTQVPVDGPGPESNNYLPPPPPPGGDYGGAPGYSSGGPGYTGGAPSVEPVGGGVDPFGGGSDLTTSIPGDINVGPGGGGYFQDAIQAPGYGARTEQLPVGFDTGDTGYTPGVNESGGDMIPQDISVSAGGFFVPPPMQQQSYGAPSQETFSTPEEFVPDNTQPEAQVLEVNLNVPQLPAGTPPDIVAPSTEQGLLPPLPPPPAFEDGGMQSGSSQAQIQSEYFEGEPEAEGGI